MKISTAFEQMLDLGLHIVAPATARARTESPAYEVLSTEGQFELRRYAGQIVAETTATGPKSEVEDDLFPRLAGFIFASERDGPEIDMTTPVQLAPEGISVADDPTGAGVYTMRFVMPAKWTIDTLPRPRDPRVSIREVPARRVAVLSFKGAATDEVLRSKAAALRAHVAEQGWTAEGAVEFASYDPPVTPAPFKLHEVRVAVAD
ncbi:SOUL family heme-binding protein [Jannaschia sp. KMU-145]|uniref:SOUL family heme-binding protein n=1 Tax=Jannaschia halovivens TaxID=3388667 RepID=UPI00396B1A59